MIGSDEQGGALTGRRLAAVGGLAVAWIAWGLVRHPGFMPAQALRTAAPVLALLVGGLFTRAVALVRARADAEREFDRGGKALFMGFVMVAGTFVGWLLVSQAIPATWTALVGEPGTAVGMVDARPAPGSDADCRYRLIVSSTAPGQPGVPDGAALEECVDLAVWQASDTYGPVSLRVVRGRLGQELVGVESAHR